MRVPQRAKGSARKKNLAAQVHRPTRPDANLRDPALAELVGDSSRSPTAGGEPWTFLPTLFERQPIEVTALEREKNSSSSVV